ncbi:DUF6802 family protein [Antrihabitans cavernicola]|uniref:DUF6802 domain-containing protein n=1 Tax=Antrihabitans cavernicola TaxID=2495913 RepID=A0A5A7S501_9NOCA|nr:DUF6802 family protein [Spelaeibacter cavernicola]KAA0016306.1 hypothetical protein FOY51_26495 [Spelaeibacter cavernicola]
MIASNDFLLPDLPHIDASSSLDDLGAVALDHPTQDIDGDGTPDTNTITVDDSLVVVSDIDLDGFADHLSVVDHTGEFASWQFTQGADGEPHWEQTDHGRLGE